MTLAHDVAGQGPAVVLLHSGVCDRRMWDAQWRALAEDGNRVVRCDLRGFGETPVPDRPHSDADDVLDLMDTLGIGRATLVGSSYGGKVALETAARGPDRADGLVLLCSALSGHPPSDRLRALDEREDAFLDRGDIAGATELMVGTWLGPEADEHAREAVRRMQRHAYEVQLAAPEEFGTLRHDVDLAALRMPALVVSGAHDLADFRDIAVHLARLLPDARHVELPWAGHLPGLERPAAVTDLLTGFLRRERTEGR
ncbi:alpha/beta fold hydrolase [Streptomyces sp. NPDC090306]|uniref:alpha/beta fold hydrolase n=1 Tax=Streptomyces sp. NPDC090306 TaxID=3365961 RepID=UPI0037FA9D38